ADLVVWSGDPLSVYSRADLTYVDGRLRFDRQADEAHRARVAAAREQLAAEVRGGPAKPAAAEAPFAVTPASPRFAYRPGRHAPAGAVAITGATVHTLEGPAIADGVVVFESGRITAVGGPGTPVPASAATVDGKGKHLWPGLI